MNICGKYKVCTIVSVCTGKNTGVLTIALNWMFTLPNHFLVINVEVKQIREITQSIQVALWSWFTVIGRFPWLVWLNGLFAENKKSNKSLQKSFLQHISLVLFDIDSLRNIDITPQIRIFDIGHKNILVVKVIQTANNPFSQTSQGNLPITVNQDHMGES
jgi:hypothetical protein